MHPNSIYQQKIDRLFEQAPSFQVQGKAAYHPGMEVMKSFDTLLSHPHRQYGIIHVAGTNGKGSVSSFLAAVLAMNGYKVGLYTSPHLVDFRERVKILEKKGEKVQPVCISEKEVLDFLDRTDDFVKTSSPSFFEITTAMAFDCFRRRKVDVAVVEAGLGGRLDSTNIISPMLSVITSIGLDHTGILGDTVEKIAYEKGGIIKDGIPVVVGKMQESVLSVLQHLADEHHAPLIQAREQPVEAFPSGEMDLKGEYQSLNLATVLSAVEVLERQGMRLEKENSMYGLQHAAALTVFRGRWEQLSVAPDIYCDIAHNACGLRPVMHQLKEMRDSGRYGRLVVILGMAADKVNDQVLELFPSGAEYFVTQARGTRAMPAAELSARLKHHVDSACRNYASVEEAVHAYLHEKRSDDLVYIGGSSYVVAEALVCF